MTEEYDTPRSNGTIFKFNACEISSDEDEYKPTEFTSVFRRNPVCFSTRRNTNRRVNAYAKALPVGCVNTNNTPKQTKFMVLYVCHRNHCCCQFVADYIDYVRAYYSYYWNYVTHQWF